MENHRSRLCLCRDRRIADVRLVPDFRQADTGSRLSGRVRKGNVAVAIFIAALFVSIALIIGGALN